jgi:hypothetical protein
MTEPRRSVWGALDDIWSDDDEAVARMRAVLKPPPVPEAPQPRQKAEVAPDATPEPVTTPSEALSRRGRISDLIARVRAGDLAGVDLLRRALDRD